MQRQKTLQQQLTHFWNQQWREMEEATDFRNHNLPLACCRGREMPGGRAQHSLFGKIPSGKGACGDAAPPG